MQSEPIIIGLGKSGFSCAKYFERSAQSFRVIDTREVSAELVAFQQCFPQVPLYLGGINTDWLNEASEIILSPGLSHELPELQAAKAKGVKILGDIALFARVAQAPIIAITGTNAKGTVTTLLGEMIKQAGFTVQVGGNIGIPALDLLAYPVPDFYVLEVSSFQLETTAYLPTRAATILNMSVDHLDRHGSMENYHGIKQRIYDQCETAVFNPTDARTVPCSSFKQHIHFSLEAPLKDAFGIRDQHLAFGETLLLSTEGLRIKGKHNWLNALAALALGHAIDLPHLAMIEALKVFPGLEHRCEWVASQRHVSWYNDSKGTNVGATVAALEGLGPTLSGKIILIAGGKGKGADFSVLQDAVKHYVRHLVLIGEDAPLLAKALQGQVNIDFCQGLAASVALAQQYAEPGDAVLLSPACASYDMFHDFEDRGRQFKSLVKEQCKNDRQHTAN